MVEWDLLKHQRPSYSSINEVAPIDQSEASIGVQSWIIIRIFVAYHFCSIGLFDRRENLESSLRNAVEFAVVRVFRLYEHESRIQLAESIFQRLESY